MNDQERQQEIERLRAKKVALLDKHGIVGGGEYVNQLHGVINKQLEALGVDPN